MRRSQAVLSISKVTKDMQTWRKEFKNEGPSSLPAPPLNTQTAKKDDKKKKPLQGLPIFEYQDRGFKWVIENHNKESVTKEVAKDGVITVEISDPKQQVYFYNCDGVTVKVIGKFKSLILDKCTGCSVIYDSLISIAETVNCKKIQLQVLGVCPAFTIDKTIGCLIWLSAESKEISTFTTNLSSELNVSFPDGEDQKECPIPEQFVHRLTNGSLKSEVSDLYH
jgi:adenylyl cyclase-associated protein